jgi:hypothetical protein
MIEIDPGAAFNVAQDAALRASPDLVALFNGAPRIFGVVPQNAPLPYVRIGDDQIIEDGIECLGGSEIISLVHVWSRPDPPGVILGRQIAGVIRAVLYADLGIAGHDTILWEFEDTRHLTDPDGSSHAVLTFRYLTTPIAADAP